MLHGWKNVDLLMTYSFLWGIIATKAIKRLLYFNCPFLACGAGNRKDDKLKIDIFKNKFALQHLRFAALFGMITKEE